MNALQRAMMDAPSLLSDRCVICGKPYPEGHHIIPRSQGGHKGPQVSLCGPVGAKSCHDDAHAKRLHFTWDGESWHYRIGEPTKLEAISDDEWIKVR